MHTRTFHCRCVSDVDFLGRSLPDDAAHFTSLLKVERDDRDRREGEDRIKVAAVCD